MSSKRNDKQIEAILLAAGGSQRLGQPKQLIHFNDEILINYILGKIIKGGLSDIKVILGSHFKEIKNQIIYDDIEVIENRDWKEGISSSIKCGIKNINSEIEAVMFFVVDQPFLDSSLVERVLEKSRTSNAEIIAVSVSGQLSHPVLFKRTLFPDLLKVGRGCGR